MAEKIISRTWDLPAYISFDIDALDPAYAPGTGTPEVGGFTTMFALEVVEKLVGWNMMLPPECSEKSNLIGMDVVEVSPPYDHSDITALAAATLMWTFASSR